MERDFLGLKSTELVVMTKEEIINGARDSGFTRGSGMLLSFMNKVHTLPQHYMSFKVAQEDRSKSVSGTNAFNPGHNRPIGEVKNFNYDGKEGTHFTTLHRPHGVKLQPIPNISLSMNNPVFKTHFTGLSRQNLAGVSAKQQLVGEIVSVTATQPTQPSDGSVVGFTGQWHNAKASSSLPQLTIFFGGKVYVYDDISPQKAEAIMLLARNGSSMASTAIHQRSIVSVPKITNPMGSVSGATMRQSDIPQARKASLARFLEKRKERVMTTAAPYELGKKSQECA